MKPECLLALKGDITVVIEAKDIYTIQHLVRLNKIKEGELPYDPDYDFNRNGAVDDKDSNTLRLILMLDDGVFNPDRIKY